MSSIQNKLRHYAKLRGVSTKRYAKKSKLKEETSELIQAMRQHKKRGTMRSQAHLMEEVADVLWCIAAISEENGFTVEDAAELKTARDWGRNIRNG